MNLVFLPPAEKYLKKIKDKELKRKFQKTVDAIMEDPFIGELKHGDLSGVRCCDIYHQRTNYELAYHVTFVDDQVVVVIMAGTRENFYEALKPYWKKQKKRL